VDEFAGVPENKPNTNTFSRECKTCSKTFHYQQSFDFDQEKHKMEKTLREETADQGFTFSGALPIQSLMESTPWDHFPQYATPSVTHALTVAADTSLLVNVCDLISIKCVDATTQGVHGRDVLVRTSSDTIQLVPTVSFFALVSQKGITERVRDIMGPHAYDGALHLQRTCRWLPLCSFWTNHLQLEDIVPNEDERCLLEGGIECPFTCVRTFSSK
jgi:hypothetical protein